MPTFGEITDTVVTPTQEGSQCRLLHHILLIYSINVYMCIHVLTPLHP